MIDLKKNIGLLLIYEVVFFISIFVSNIISKLGILATMRNITPFQIFINNFIIALAMTIPYIGFFFSLFHIIVAGGIVGAKSGFSVALAYFSYPHTHLELFSYTFFVMVGYYLIQRDFKNAMIEFVTGTILLLISAYVEYMTMKILIG